MPEGIFLKFGSEGTFFGTTRANETCQVSAEHTSSEFIERDTEKQVPKGTAFSESGQNKFVAASVNEACPA